MINPSFLVRIFLDEVVKLCYAFLVHGTRSIAGYMVDYLVEPCVRVRFTGFTVSVRPGGHVAEQRCVSTVAYWRGHL